MEYKELSKLYHMDRSASRDSNLRTELETRRSASSTFHTGFETPNGELFIAVPRELTILEEQVLRVERKVSRLMRSMPPIARNAVLRGMVLDEVVGTNAIEDIHSTRRQVKDALDASRTASPAERRFKELATLYLDIAYGEAEKPSTPEDIRSIYDKVMDGEFGHVTPPDGMLFRSEGVVITAGGARVLHSGLEPESEIVKAMRKMIEIADTDAIPSVFAAIASHYIFEYAHPFYDGNGRTGRYLLSLYLSAPLSIPTVISLSRTIAENRDEYYKAFRTVEDPLNHGELTFFVQALLQLVRKAQDGVVERLELCDSLFSSLKDKVPAIAADYGLKPQEVEATFALMQYEVFGIIGDASVQDVAAGLRIGEQMARKHLKRLEEKGVAVKRHLRKPLTFSLSDDFKGRYQIVATNWRLPTNNDE